MVFFFFFGFNFVVAVGVGVVCSCFLEVTLVFGYFIVKKGREVRKKTTSLSPLGFRPFFFS